jgi:hypothetical protein
MLMCVIVTCAACFALPRRVPSSCYSAMRTVLALENKSTEIKCLDLIDLRASYTALDVELRPGKGLACSVRRLPEFAAAVTKALEKAQALRLLENGGAE